MRKRFNVFVAMLFAVSCMAVAFAGCDDTSLHTHTLVNHPAITASCAADGNTEYWSCDCGKIFSDSEGKVETSLEEVTLTDGHTWGEWIIDTQPSCAADGQRRRTCAGCKDTEIETIAATEHTYGTEWSSDAEYHWHAATCGHTDEIKDKAAHNWNDGEITTQPGCLTEGVKTFACDDCEESKTEVIPISHNYGEWKYDNYSHWKECKVCQHVDKGVHSVNADNTCADCECAVQALSYKKIYGGYEVAGIGTITDTDIIILDTYGGLPVTSIGDYAFRGCSALTSITIPDGISSIGRLAFKGCSSLSSITVAEENTRYHSAGDCLIETSSKTLLAVGCSNSIIPSDGSVTSIGEWVFSGSSLTSITIPDSVTSIGNSAFWGCSSLTNITIPDSVTSISHYVFEGCANITTATMPTTAIVCLPKSNLETVVLTGNNGIDSSAFSGCNKLKSVTIGNGVTSIGDAAFSGCSSLTRITIPDSVTSIGSYAFEGCSSLTSITIGNSVTSIGHQAFRGCSSLTSITVAEGNTRYHSAGDCIIETASKTLIAGCNNSIIPSDGSVTSIGDYAFYNCSSLTSIVIPDSVTSIGDRAFEGCENITTATMPAIAIAHLPTSNLETVVLTGNNGIDSSAFSGCSSLTRITIPDSVTSIGSSAFSGCSSLTSIVIPDSVTSIDNSAFSGCSSLTSITVAEGNTRYHSEGDCLIETASKTLIVGCSNSIIPSDGSVTSIGDWAFSGSSLTSIVIPDGVTSIGEYAFQYCSGLTNIIIPDSVTSIGNEAFKDCKNIMTATMPATAIAHLPTSNLETVVLTGNNGIDSSAFSGCNKLKSVIIGNGVTSIGFSAFYNCSSLTSIVIPDSVTSIGNYAFRDCSGLKEVRITDIASWCAISFYDSSSNPLLFANSLYLNDTLVTDLVIPDNVTSIGSWAFYGCSSLTGITIGNGVTSIGSSAFYGCSSLTSITIPDGVTSIGERAFEDCSSLTSITVAEGNSTYHSAGDCLIETASKTLIVGCSNSIIPSDGSVTSIGDRAFYYCRSLTSITIPDSVTSIGELAFNGCDELQEVRITDIAAWCAISFSSSSSNPLSYANNLYLNDTLVTDLVIPDSVTSIGGFAFDGCSSLTDITIPNSVTSIGEYAFGGCSSLTSITIPDGVTRIDTGAFSGCSGLKEVRITDIAAWCAISFGSPSSNPFYYVNNLYLNGTLVTDLVIPDGVTSIGDYAFSSCSSLTSITIPDSVTRIDTGAFSGCSSLMSIVIPDSVTSIGSSAFYGCSSLMSIVIPDSVTSIGNSAFYNCSSLTSITIPDGVTSIGGYAFSGCILLRSIAIGKGVTSIGGYAFSNCSWINSIKIADENTTYHSAGNCIIDTASRKLIRGCKNSIIPSDGSVTSIGDRAFSDCGGLTSITIPDSVTSIGSSAFSDCYWLTSITIGNGVTSIGSSAFSGCKELKSVTIGNGVTSIGEWAFYHCSGLEEVYYAGTSGEWSNISIGGYNTDLTQAKRYYYSKEQPTGDGNYWHYGTDGVTIIKW